MSEPEIRERGAAAWLLAPAVAIVMTMAVALLAVVLVGTDGDLLLASCAGAKFTCRGTPAAGPLLRVLIRPEQLQLSRPGETAATWRGLKVLETVPLGESTRIVVGAEGLELAVTALGRSPFGPGDVVDCRAEHGGPVVVPG